MLGVDEIMYMKVFVNSNVYAIKYQEGGLWGSIWKAGLTLFSSREGTLKQMSEPGRQPGESEEWSRERRGEETVKLKRETQKDRRV